MDSRFIGLLIIQLWQGVTWSAVLNDRAFAEDYLKKYHYISDDKTSKEMAQMVDKDPDVAFTQKLALFQEYAGISVTGIFDNQTRESMLSRRCGMPDIISMANLAKRKRRYAFQGSRWNKIKITYRIENYPKSDITKKEVDGIIDQAFKVWATVTLLEFNRLEPPAKADINIRYDIFWHGDNFPFDGYGGSLAHAFFPEYGGDVHFDDNEIWTSGTYHGTNLFQVTVHEIGHSLGLAHSRNPGSLMAPLYKGYTPDFKLHDDDVQAIQILYGIPDDIKQITWTEPPLSIPAQRSPPCESITFDAITSHREGGRTHTYAFFGKLYALIDDHGIATGWPSYIARDWPGLPSDLDAALYWPPTQEQIRVNRNQYVLVEKAPARTYFFKGHLYWRYQEKKLMPGYPKPIMYGFRGVPSNLDAAFVWSGNGLTYFIKGQKYYRYIRSQAVDYGYPKPLWIWRGLPSTIDAAFSWEGNHMTYFFSGKEYYKFSDSNFKVHNGYPRTISKWWLNCPRPNQSLQAPSTKSTDQVDQSTVKFPEVPETDRIDITSRGCGVQTATPLYYILFFFILMGFS